MKQRQHHETKPKIDFPGITSFLKINPSLLRLLSAVYDAVLQLVFYLKISKCSNLCLIKRSIYPGGDGQYSRLSGCGLLRLHSTYRHDLKIYASDEGRVQMTAAAFAKVSESRIFMNKFFYSLMAFRTNKDVVNTVWY